MSLGSSVRSASHWSLQTSPEYASAADHSPPPATLIHRQDSSACHTASIEAGEALLSGAEGTFLRSDQVGF